MKFYSLFKQEVCSGIWKVELEHEEWKNALLKAKKKIIDNYVHSGYRRGHVPENIVFEKVSSDDLLLEAHKLIFKDVFLFAHEMGNKEKKLTFFKSPELVTKIPKEISKDYYKVEFFFETFPTVKLSDYKKQLVTLKKVSVSQEEVDKLFFKLKEELQKKGITEGNKKLVLEDVILFDLKVYNQKKLLKEFSKDNIKLALADKKILTSISEYLVGKKITLGKEITFSVVIPNNDKYFLNYNSQQGTLSLSVLVKKVFWKEKGLSDENFVKNLGINDIKTVDNFKDFILKKLTKQNEFLVRKNFLNKFFTEIISTSEFFFPQSIIAKETNFLFQNFLKKMEEKSVDFSDYQQKTKLTQSEIKKRLQKDAILNLKRASAEMEIIQRENITHDEKDVEKQVLMFAEKMKKKVSEINKNYLRFIEFESTRNNLYHYLFKHHLVVKD